MRYSPELEELDGAFPAIPATSCFGMAPSQPAISGWESRGESKEKAPASLGERAKWGWQHPVSHRCEAGMLKSSARQLRLFLSRLRRNLGLAKGRKQARWWLVERQSERKETWKGDEELEMSTEKEN